MTGQSLFTAYTVYWFFRRKAKIVFLTVMTYAAMC